MHPKDAMSIKVMSESRRCAFRNTLLPVENSNAGGEKDLKRHSRGSEDGILSALASNVQLLDVDSML